MRSWHTAAERRLVRLFGGEPHVGYGPDGQIDGRPVEVRVNRQDDRFRLGQDVHETLMAEGGSYIFDAMGDGRPPAMVPAAEVDTMLGPNWYRDRGYPHQFVDNQDIFGGGGDGERRTDPLGFGIEI